MTSPDRAARSWHVQIHALKFSIFVAENLKGEPIEVHMIGGGPLATTLADLCKSMTLGLQRGMKVSDYTRTLRGRSDEMGGPVIGDPLVSDCGSVVDYLAKSLDIRYPSPP